MQLCNWQDTVVIEGCWRSKNAAGEPGFKVTWVTDLEGFHVTRG